MNIFTYKYIRYIISSVILQVIVLKEEISKIEKEVEELGDKIGAVYFEYSDLFGEDNNKKNTKRNEQYEIEQRRKFFELNKRLDVLYHIDFAMENNPDIVSDTLDLYLENYDDITQARQYTIFIHDTKEYVGKIRYKGENYSMFGNVAYEIEEKHRGNHYALISLRLMSEKLYQKGIRDLYISAECHNKASIKTIKKFGGIMFDNDGFIVQYKCDLKRILNINDNIINRK